MTRFRTRPMEPDDESSFNSVFNSIVAGARPPRPLHIMRHLWHDAPGGPVRSWLIEANDGNGAWEIVGHHGLCPVRFTMGDTDLTFAKTINTFLLPEFRNKFVYLRFERQCLEEVEQDFDATYTLTPVAARPRAALGYETVATLGLEMGARPFGFGSRVLAHLERRHSNPVLHATAMAWASLSAKLFTRPELTLTEYNRDTAADDPFFMDFWKRARPTAGLAPRRDIADLKWRFWNTAGAHRTTLAYAWPDGSRAYCVVNHTNRFRFVLEDIYLAVPSPAQLQQFIDAVRDWCTNRGALMTNFLTTPESQPPPLLEIYRRNMKLELSSRYRHSPMSRRLTANGRARIGPSWPSCNITAIVAPA